MSLETQHKETKKIRHDHSADALGYATYASGFGESPVTKYAADLKYLTELTEREMLQSYMSKSFIVSTPRKGKSIFYDIFKEHMNYGQPMPQPPTLEQLQNEADAKAKREKREAALKELDTKAKEKAAEREKHPQKLKANDLDEAQTVLCNARALRNWLAQSAGKSVSNVDADYGLSVSTADHEHDDARNKAVGCSEPTAVNIKSRELYAKFGETLKTAVAVLAADLEGLAIETIKNPT